MAFDDKNNPFGMNHADDEDVFDMSGVEDVPERQLMTPGIYPAHIASVTAGTSKTSGYPYWCLQVTIDQEPYSGQSLWDYRTLSRTPKNLRFAKQAILAFLASKGQHLSKDASVTTQLLDDMLPGLPVRVKVVQVEDPQYGMQNKVDRIYPVASEDAPSSPEALGRGPGAHKPTGNKANSLF